MGGALGGTGPHIQPEAVAAHAIMLGFSLRRNARVTVASPRRDGEFKFNEFKLFPHFRTFDFPFLSTLVIMQTLSIHSQVPCSYLVAKPDREPSGHF